MSVDVLTAPRCPRCKSLDLAIICQRCAGELNAGRSAAHAVIENPAAKKLHLGRGLHCEAWQLGQGGWIICSACGWLAAKESIKPDAR